MASSKAPGSILEVSGSILDPSGFDFRDFLGWLVACNRRIYLMHELLHETRRGIHLGFSFPTRSAAVRAQHIRLLPKGEPSVLNKEPFIFLFACL